MFKIRKRFLFSAAALASAAVIGVTAVWHSCALPAFVSAAETETGTTYTEGDDTYTFSYGETDGWVLSAYEGKGRNLTLPAPEKVVPQTGLPALTSYAIGNGVFADNSALSAVVIPEGVTAIGENAFRNTTVTETTVPASVTQIGANAFYGCWVLSSLFFEEGDIELALGESCFYDCISLTSVELPARVKAIGQSAFGGCRSLQWAYVNSSALTQTGVFPAENGDLTVVFSVKADYSAALADGAIAEENATYLIKLTFNVAGATPQSVQKLYGKSFAYRRNTDETSREYNGWCEDGSLVDLPAQDENYASTVWYSDAQLTQKIALSDVNALLTGADKPETIALYAHETVTPPSLNRNVSHVYDKQSYALTDVQSLCEIVGIADYEHKSALVFSALAEGGSGALTGIGNTGTYLVSVSLNGEYGVWKSQPVTTLTVTGGQERTSRIMLVLLSVFGLLAVVLTIALVLVRSRITRKKRKELTSEEVIDKFIAAGGRTRLKK